MAEWQHGGPTDIDNLALVCDTDHARITDSGWRTTADPSGHRPLWTAPRLLDPTRTPRRNHRHHPHELVTHAILSAPTNPAPRRRRRPMMHCSDRTDPESAPATDETCG